MKHRMAYGARALRPRSPRSSPRAGKPPTWRRGTGVVEASLVAQELLPGDVPRVRVPPDDGPVGDGDPAGLAFDARRCIGRHPRERPGAAVDVRAGVPRVVQDVEDAAVA